MKRRVKRIVPAIALAVVLGTTQIGCPFTAAGALIGLIAGAVSDDPAMDRNDHVRKGALIGLEVDAAVFCGITTGCMCSGDEGAPMQRSALLDFLETEVEGAPRNQVIVGPVGCTVRCSF